MVENLQLSVVVPIYNEASGLEKFNSELVRVLKATGRTYEIIYCDDGSTDNSLAIVSALHKGSPNIRACRLTRNFGKEYALLAGLSQARGEATLMIDGDGQHPVELIPKFLKAWDDGFKVVVGIRKSSGQESFLKNIGSRLFYFLFNNLSRQHLIPGSTDFRLIDSSVRQVFLSMKEADRITRGLIDWLGFKTEYIYFDANPRATGQPSYSNKKLFKLATSSFVSLSPTPLYLFGYLGVLITLGSIILGLTVFIEQVLLNDPLHWKFTGTAMLGILILCLVGIVLMSQGIMSRYVSYISNQSKARPLYVIDYERSEGIEREH